MRRHSVTKLWLRSPRAIPVWPRLASAQEAIDAAVEFRVSDHRLDLRPRARRPARVARTRRMNAYRPPVQPDRAPPPFSAKISRAICS
jgi:hypothetical protein